LKNKELFIPNEFLHCVIKTALFAASLLGRKFVSTCDFSFGSTSVPAVDHGVYGAVNRLAGAVARTIPVLTVAPDSGMTVAGDLVFDANAVPNAGGATASAAVYEVGGVEYVVYGFGGDPSFGSLHRVTR
jgi:hypothetical protein